MAQLSRNGAPRSKEHYKIHKQLYKSSISGVFHAEDLNTGEHVALKVYKKHRMRDSASRVQLEREIAIHVGLQHENIIDLLAVFEDDRAVYLVQSYARGGDLFGALHAVGCFDEARTAGTVIVPLLKALDYIHAKGIIHRDIKIENILLDASGVLKLADFGLAIDSNTARPGSRLGTWEYMAPEIHLCPFVNDPAHGSAADGGTTYSSAVDVWAVGILAYELMVGRSPFSVHGTRMRYEDVMEDLVFPDYLCLSPDACSFIKSALCKQGRLRPTAGQLLKHRWLRRFVKEDVEDSARSTPHSASRCGSASLQGLSARPAESGTRQQHAWASRPDSPSSAEPSSSTACSTSNAHASIHPAPPPPDRGSPHTPIRPAPPHAARLASREGPKRSMSDLSSVRRARLGRELAAHQGGEQQQATQPASSLSSDQLPVTEAASAGVPAPGGHAPGASGSPTRMAAHHHDSMHSSLKRSQSRPGPCARDSAYALQPGATVAAVGSRRGSGQLRELDLDVSAATALATLRLPCVKGAMAAERGQPAGALPAPRGVRTAAMRTNSCPDLLRRGLAGLGLAEPTAADSSEECMQAMHGLQRFDTQMGRAGAAVAAQLCSSQAPPADPPAATFGCEAWAAEGYQTHHHDEACTASKGSRLSRLASMASNAMQMFK